MKEELKKYGNVLSDVSLKEFNTYKLESFSKYLVYPNSITDLVQLINYLDKENVKYFILGNGSNVILPSHTFNGVVIKTSGLKGVKDLGDNKLYAEAGVMLPKLVSDSLYFGYKGLEWAAGIPGTVGGSIVGNAGAYKSCIFDYLLCVTILEGGITKTLKKDDIIYSYRHTSLKGEKCIVLSAVFSLEKGNMEESKELIKSRYLRRVETQPLDKPSAGSVFRNPIDEPAGKIIEDLGFKGTCCNGAKVSEKHANFIVNSGNATSEDVISLINDIKKCVKEKKNIDLVLEQEIVSWE